jgi:hypothetical protein
MKVRRLLAVIVLVSVPLGLSVGPAGASAPIGSCPPAFQGPLTFQQIIDTFPPPAGVDPIAFLTPVDKNADGSLCVRPFKDSTDINVIDNTVRIP